MNTADKNKTMVEVYSKLVEAEKQIKEGKVLDWDTSLKSMREKYEV